MIKLKCDLARFKEALRLERSLGKKDTKTGTLTACLKYLRQHGDNGSEVTVFNDWAKHSFSFLCQHNGSNYKFHGGIICHNLPDSCNPLATTLSDNKEIFWSIHT